MSTPDKPMNRLQYEQHLIKTTTVCNERLYKRVAALQNLSPKQVEEMFNEVASFVAKTIKEGAYETVMIPLFGKFAPKTEMIQWKQHKYVMPMLNTDLEPKTPDEDEAICD